MIAHYQPDVIVLEDASAKESRRSARVQTLNNSLAALAKGHNVKVAQFSRTQVRRMFFVDDQGNKHALAELLATRFPEELASRMPPKRRPWMSEDYRMDIFDAVALASVLSLRKDKSRYRFELKF
jgi:hypothetical protein